MLLLCEEKCSTGNRKFENFPNETTCPVETNLRYYVHTAILVFYRIVKIVAPFAEVCNLASGLIYLSKLTIIYGEDLCHKVPSLVWLKCLEGCIWCCKNGSVVILNNFWKITDRAIAHSRTIQEQLRVYFPWRSPLPLCPDQHLLLGTAGDIFCRTGADSK